MNSYKDGDILVFNNLLYKFGGYSEFYGGKGVVCLNNQDKINCTSHPDFVRLATEDEIKNLKWGTWWPFDD